MKRLEAEASGKINTKGGLKGLSNEKCDNCDTYLKMLEKRENELEEMEQELAKM